VKEIGNQQQAPGREKAPPERMGGALTHPKQMADAGTARSSLDHSTAA